MNHLNNKKMLKLKLNYGLTKLSLKILLHLLHLLQSNINIRIIDSYVCNKTVTKL